MHWTNGTEFLDLGLSSGCDEDKARLLHNETELNPESSFVLAPASNAFFRTHQDAISPSNNMTCTLKVEVEERNSS